MKNIFVFLSLLALINCTKQPNTDVVRRKELNDEAKFGRSLNPERLKRTLPIIDDQLELLERYSYDGMQLVYQSKEELTQAKPIHWRKVLNMGKCKDSLSELPYYLWSEHDIYQKLIIKDSILTVNIGHDYCAEDQKDKWLCWYSGFFQIDPDRGVTNDGPGSGRITFQQADSILTTWGIKRINH